MEKYKVIIDGIEVVVPSDYTVMEAADEAGVYIPRLCYVKGIHEESSCRVCAVEIEGMPTLKNACKMPIYDNMVVTTSSDRVLKNVKKNLELTAANHVFECWVCPREHNCEFLDLLRTYDVENTIGESENFSKKERVINDKSSAIVLDSGKCTLCGRCVSACRKQTSLGILDFINRGTETIIGPSSGYSMEEAGCIYCGKCLQACPVAAIKEKDNLTQLEEVLRDPNKFVVVQAAPAVRSALGEEFGLPIGTNTEGKMYRAFEMLGFDEIADTNYGADLTIMEEGTEFIERLNNNGVFPMFTSCSPGWVRYIETYQPEFLANLSSAKSPHQMAGAIVKHYFAPKLNVDPKDVVNVSIMPCIAKKFESSREEMEYNGLRDVDIVVTTRELARLIKRRRINFLGLEDLEPKGEIASYTGAGAIFGVTGGVMEAALRTVSDVLEGKDLEKIDYKEVRGFDGVKEATLNIQNTDINIAVVHGGSAISQFFDHLKTTDKKYHFVEFMGCIGGCINGGGQPIVNSETMEKVDYKQLRASVLYNQDASATVRKSHHNESIKRLYEEFLDHPCSHKAHDILHTKYSKREIYPEKE